MIHTALKPFQCHKRVHAAKITRLEPAKDSCVVALDGSAVGLAIPLAWYLKHQPQPGWYIVVYEDGYVSFSPPEAFETGYSPIDKPAAATQVSRRREIYADPHCRLRVTSLDAPGPGGAHHFYEITYSERTLAATRVYLKFQRGTVKQAGANGLTNEALLAIVEDRLAAFQAGATACDENQAALQHVRDAIHHLGRRTQRRLSLGIEGTETP